MRYRLKLHPPPFSVEVLEAHGRWCVRLDNLPVRDMDTQLQCLRPTMDIIVPWLIRPQMQCTLIVVVGMKLINKVSRIEMKMGGIGFL